MTSSTKSKKKFSFIFTLILSFVAVFSAVLFLPKTETIDSVSAFEYNGVTYSDKVWVYKSWSFQLRGRDIWTDGTNFYYSYNAGQRVLNISNGTTSKKTWTGLTNFSGEDVWTDGINFYYSNGTSQYVLDVSTSTWSVKTWTGLTNFSGQYIWFDGTNYNYSDGTQEYVLDVSTSTWSSSGWSGVDQTILIGNNFWTDGINFYYSYGTSQYIVNISTRSFSPYSWNNAPSSDFLGRYIWTDGTNVYFSNGNSSGNYILNVSTSTWSNIHFTLFDQVVVADIWSDGTNVYYNNSNNYNGAMFINFTDLLTGGYDIGYQDGYTVGQSAGYSSGYSAGETAGYNSGYTAGETAGYQTGYNAGYDAGYDISSNVGYQDGLETGYQSGYSAGYSAGYDNGYESYSSLGFFPYDNFNLPSNVNLSDVANLQLWYDGSQYRLGLQYAYDESSSMWVYSTYNNFPVPVNNAEYSYYYYFYDGYRINAICSDTSFSSYYLDTSTNTWVAFSNLVDFSFISQNSGGSKYLNIRSVYEYNNELYIYSSSDNDFYKWNNFTHTFVALSVDNMPTINSSNYTTFHNFVVMDNPSQNTDNATLYFCTLYNRLVNNNNDYQFMCYSIDLTQSTLSCTLFDTYRVQTATGQSGKMSQSGLFTDGNNLYFALTDLSGLFNNYTAMYLPDSSDSNIVHEVVVFPLLQGPVMVNYLKTFDNLPYLFTTNHYTNVNPANAPIFRYDDTLVYSFHLYDIDMYDTGYNTGYVAGVDYSKRIVDRSSASYNAGYTAGVDSAGNYTFNGLLGSVIDVPVETFRSLLNFNVLGVNILDFLLGLLTLAFVVFIVKLLLGGK